jgi:peptidoglycan/xylan/chitin deacetylase (PgdA/CDA1 family)
MRSFCFTVDVDRDANIPVPGMSQAGSYNRGLGTAPRFRSSGEGIGALTEILDEMGVKATYFAEARTLSNIGAHHLVGREVGIHGFDHEDFTGTFPPGGKKEVLNRACEAVEDLTGKRPRCSRMPYMKISEDVPPILAEIGIRYDSSTYRDMEKEILPYGLAGVVEFPVPVANDASGKKIVGYLWPMHEGKRPPGDYIEMASRMENGTFILATHSWHMSERIDGGYVSKQDAKANENNVREAIAGILDLGYEAETLPDAAERFGVR